MFEVLNVAVFRRNLLVIEDKNTIRSKHTNLNDAIFSINIYLRSMKLYIRWKVEKIVNSFSELFCSSINVQFDCSSWLIWKKALQQQTVYLKR